MTNFTHTEVANIKLMAWRPALETAIALTKAQILFCEELDMRPDFYESALAELEDMHQWVSMSWETWMDSITTTLEGSNK